MKKLLSILMALVLSIGLFAGCTGEKAEPEQVQNGSIILSTTTSTRDSGLLDYILPEFTKDTGIEVKVVAVGTGKALEMGKNGEADVLLVHAKASEEAFVEAGDGLERHDVMYNDFVLVGPQGDPAGVKEAAPSDIVAAFEKINSDKLKFVSRGDDSGTHKKELALWSDTGITPEGDYYVEAGSGMADVLKMADEMKAYTLTDRATYLNLKDNLSLEIAVEKDEKMFNQYGVIPVNPEKTENINAQGAKAFVDWLLSEKAQKMISEYGVDRFGMPLFTPNASK
ncbi:tungstate transport system substrate-binding protein [Peptoclostridium litorale DSM 5388]|uniref:Putative ABC transporter anion-binding protein n=1 Tax=Peptoclostridium litorale DSM 5388 TaxID=1121324 RepID=A0A069RKV7_PEPLI|nr:substrate-binding domain-containing protein [Peptoclostridium litorale]KDR94867.1 putative ABC transporter anion-binding protein [Peptoclostridium litorale DSM 5388]SIN94463.1 tungstate transport system substrate-binding protein [Peptoclostridium litorale DSM 5388]